MNYKSLELLLSLSSVEVVIEATTFNEFVMTRYPNLDTDLSPVRGLLKLSSVDRQYAVNLIAVAVLKGINIKF